MNCPECEKPMSWKEGLLSLSGGKIPEKGRYFCGPCNIAMKPTESRGIREGRKLAKEMEGLHPMDKKITSLPTMVQLGILRENQRDLLERINHPKEKE